MGREVFERLVFFDLETGGRWASKHPVIQVGAVAVNSMMLEPIEEFECKVRFDRHGAEPEALEINCYDSEVWEREARPPGDAAQAFSEFLRRHATRECVSKKGSRYEVADLVAHNAAFDGEFLRRWFRELNQFLPAHPQVLCTLQRAEWLVCEGYYPAPTDFKLATLLQHFGVEELDGSAHDALYDAKAALGLYRVLRSMNGDAKRSNLGRAA